MPSPRDSFVKSAVRDWLARLLSEAQVPDAGAAADTLAPEVERALRAAALDMLRQCSVAQFGTSDDAQPVEEWTVSVQEALIAAIRRLENRRLDR